MTHIQHPSSLNPWQQYRQACSILSHTSRASNPAWYQNAVELDLQLHIRPDGPNVFTSYYDRKSNQWSPGPQLNEKALRSEEAFEPIAEEILKYAKSNKASAIGIIIHIADEFATAELKPEFDNPGSLPELRKEVATNPSQILEDANANANDASYRIVPYAAAGSDLIGTTIAVSRQLDPALNTLRKTGEDNNFPIITQSLSAPLVALSALPSMLKSQPQKAFVTILQYPWFTVLAFFNEHADLKLIRTLQHRGMRQAANFRNALFTTSTSLEFMDPDLFIIPMGEEIDTELEKNLQMNFPNSTVTKLDVPTTDGVPHWAAELVVSTNEESSQGELTSTTFTSFREDQWPYQDFLPMRHEKAEIYPAKGEMAMLRMTKMARVLIAILTLGGLGFFGLQAWKLMKTPEWSFDPQAASNSKSKLGQLATEQKRATHFNNLLQDRSKAWEAMEFFARTFPKDGNMLVKDFKYTTRTDTSAGQGSAGIIRTWKVSGFARDEAVRRLEKLRARSGHEEHFDMIAEVTGSNAYNTGLGNRSISVDFRTRENNTFTQIPFEGQASVSDPTTYPYSFELEIVQRFESNDPMALTLIPLR